MMRVRAGTGPRSVVPCTWTPSGSPHRLRVRSDTSPPDHATLPATTSTPSGNRSRVSAVSAVSVTTGKSGTASRTTLTTIRPRAVLPEELSTSYRNDMVPGSSPARITTCVSDRVPSSFFWRAYSGLALPSASVSTRSGRTSVTDIDPPVGSMSLATGLTRTELVSPTCSCT